MVTTNLAVAVMPKSKALINRPKAWARSFAIQPEISTAQDSRSVNRPMEKLRGQLTPGVSPTHSQSMNERRLASRSVGPETRVLKLKLDCSDDLTRTVSHKKKTVGNIAGNLLHRQFVLAPHWHAALFQPLRGLDENARHLTHILKQRLPDFDLWGVAHLRGVYQSRSCLDNAKAHEIL